MQSIERRLAVVTGGDSGIGLRFAEVLARRHTRLIIISNRAETLPVARDKLLAEGALSVSALCIDLCAEDAVEKVIGAIRETGEAPFIFINNAGIFSFNTLTDTPTGKIDAFISLHVKAVTDLSIAVARMMAEHREGYLLNMSSMSCWMPMPGIAMYSATKAYIRVFTRALDYEMRDAGVHVMVACPGGIATDLFGLPENLKRLAVNIRVLQTPEAFTEKAVRKLLKGKKQYINGWLNRFSIFFIGITPDFLRMQVKRRLLDRNIRRP